MNLKDKVNKSKIMLEMRIEAERTYEHSEHPEDYVDCFMYGVKKTFEILKLPKETSRNNLEQITAQAPIK